MMVMASWSLGMTVPPLSSALKPAIRSCGQSKRFNSVRFLTPACAGAGSCPPRGSSRATGWPGVSRDWGPLRYTWEHHSDVSSLMQSNSTLLHGYVLCYLTNLGGISISSQYCFSKHFNLFGVTMDPRLALR